MTSTVAGLGSRSFDFAYDDQHQLEHAIDTVDYEGQFAYTPGGKLGSAYVVAPGSPGVPARDVTYEYGSGASAYPDPEAVKVLRDGGGAALASYGYDSLGNVVSRQDPTGTTSLHYDIDAQRRAITAGGTETYYHDAGGLRTLAIDRGPGNQIEQVRFWFGETEVWYDGAGAVTHRFCSLGHGMPLLRTQQTPATSATEVVFTGPLGHTLGAIGHGGAATTLSVGYQYGPYGEILAQSGATATHLQRFNGKDHDPRTGLYYYGFRYFDPLSLRWTQNDPLYRIVPELAGADPRRGNLYQFSLNNPLRFVDPLGLDGEVTRKDMASDAAWTCWQTPRCEGTFAGEPEVTQEYDDTLVNNFFAAPSLQVVRSGPGEPRTRDRRAEWRAANRQWFAQQCAGGACDRTFRLVATAGVVVKLMWAVTIATTAGPLVAQGLAPGLVSGPTIPAAVPSNVWSSMLVTQGTVPGKLIPQSFELAIPGWRVWVHPHALRHIAERLGGGTGAAAAARAQVLLTSLQQAIRAAHARGITYEVAMNEGGWELIFSRPREAGLLPVLKHALFR